MTVKELRELLHGAKPDAEIVVHVEREKTYRIASVDHTNTVDENRRATQVIDIHLKGGFHEKTD